MSVTHDTACSATARSKRPYAIPSQSTHCSRSLISHHPYVLSCLRKIASFLDRPDIRKTIGVDPSLSGNFSGCNNDVNSRFNNALDGVFPADFYISALLERGIKTLIYVGANDWICNWVRSSSV